MSKPHDSEIVTRSAPQWAWEIIDNVVDSANWIGEVKKAVEAMKEHTRRLDDMSLSDIDTLLEKFP